MEGVYADGGKPFLVGDAYLAEWSLCTVYLLACQVRITVGESGLCCCGKCDVFQALVIALCLLILHKLSRPRPVSDCSVILIFVQVDLSEVLAVQMHRRMKEQHKVEEVIDQLQKGTKPDMTVFKKQKR